MKAYATPRSGVNTQAASLPPAPAARVAEPWHPPAATLEYTCCSCATRPPR